MTLLKYLIEAAEAVRSIPPGESNLLIILEVLPGGIEIVGYADRRRKARHIVAWEMIEQGRINLLLPAIEKMKGDLS